MESDMILTVLVWAALCFGIYKWSETLGRNSLLWTIIAVLLSPLVSGVALIFAGKTLEKKAEERIEIEKLMTKGTTE